MLSFMATNNPHNINQIIIHCSATRNGKWFTTNDIDQWHRGAPFHFKRTSAYRKRQNPQLQSIGYHFVIYTNGAVATGRHLDEIGAHAKGLNQKSIGICLIGTDKFTLAQWQSLKANINGLLKHYKTGSKPFRIIGHNEVNKAKECPGFDVQTWINGEMKPLADHLLEESYE